MSQEFCKTAQRMCDPNDCPLEFCKWRDTEWVLKKLKGWGYATSSSSKWDKVNNSSKNKSSKDKKN
jgi:hypothetical protein